MGTPKMILINVPTYILTNYCVIMQTNVILLDTMYRNACAIYCYPIIAIVTVER